MKRLEWVPWWGRLGAKLLLARLPVTYSIWRRFGLFRHGEMLDPDYAIAVFRKHFGAVRSLVAKPFAVLELGPGDSLATAPLAFHEGAIDIYLVDSSVFADRDVAGYRPLLERLGLDAAAPVRAAQSLDEMLAACRALYLTGGLESLRTIGRDSIDFIFSNAVLEHVSRAEFDEVVRELYRLQRPGGVASHQVDFRDHLGFSLNNLRFSEAIWESHLFRESGFYTNRLAPSDVVKRFRDVGYRVLRCEPEKWTRPPLARERLHVSFRGRSEEDLTTAGFHLVVQKRSR